jgi:hypothetical protein
VKKTIELLAMAESEIKSESDKSAIVGSKLVGIASYIREALTELKTPRWYTPEQWKAKTGKSWQDDWAVYTRALDTSGKWSDWVVCDYADAKCTLYEVQIVCATESGPPPDNWMPEEEQS